MGLGLFHEAAHTALGLSVGIARSVGLEGCLGPSVDGGGLGSPVRFVPLCPSEARRELILERLVEKVVSRSPIDILSISRRPSIPSLRPDVDAALLLDGVERQSGQESRFVQEHGLFEFRAK